MSCIIAHSATMPQTQTDVTEAVASLYDSLVGSIDWGSDFLSVEEIIPIVQLAKLMGWALPNNWESTLEVATNRRAVEHARAAFERRGPRDKRVRYHKGDKP